MLKKVGRDDQILHEFRFQHGCQDQMLVGRDLLCWFFEGSRQET